MWVRNVLLLIQLLSALFVIGLVLLQRGKGAEAGAGFGAGASGTVFGARGATTALSRATAVCAAFFMATSLALAYIGTRVSEQPKSLLEEAGPRRAPPAGSAAPPPASVPGGTASAPAPGSATAGTPGGTPAGAPAGSSPGTAGNAPASAPAPAPH
jgi:preprotein translocase subunit SecG